MATAHVFARDYSVVSRPVHGLSRSQSASCDKLGVSPGQQGRWVGERRISAPAAQLNSVTGIVCLKDNNRNEGELVATSYVTPRPETG